MLTNTVKTRILQAISGVASGSSSTSLPIARYMGLSTTEPQPDGTGVTEPAAAAGYAKLSISPDTSGGAQRYPFEIVSGSNNGRAWNMYEVHFNVAQSDWGEIGWVCLYDSSNNLLAYGHLVDNEGKEVTINVQQGHIPTILQHQAVISIDVE